MSIILLFLTSKFKFMTVKTETGHARNVAHFDELVNFCLGYGTAYNPAKASIKILALQTLQTAAKNAITGINTNIPAYSNAVAARELAFDPLSKLTTRIINSLKASDTTDQVVDNAKTLIRKIQGSRATPKAKITQPVQGEAVKEEDKTISTS